MNKQDLWNRITSNGMREMTEERFYQALDELAIPATERERQIVIAAMKFARKHPDNGITQFFKSESYRSIPPASTIQPDPYPDNEADGYVFCGKCGQMK
jgi:hypothetical protein